MSRLSTVSPISNKKERDTETGNDDFGARFYVSRTGRFLSVDWSSVPAPVPYANLSNPQTLNLYAFVSDNPITFADLDGHMAPNSYSYQPWTKWHEWQLPYNIDLGVYGSTGSASIMFNVDLLTQSQITAMTEIKEAQNQTTGRQPDGSYIAPTGPGSEVAKIEAAANEGKPLPLVGSGECVALTSKLTGVTDHTPDWTQGPKVVNADGTINSAVKPGTAIAAGWDANGQYPRGNVPKNSGVFLGPGVASGHGSISLMDQWKAHPPNPANPPQSRDVRFYSDPAVKVSNNSNAYYVIIVR